MKFSQKLPAILSLAFLTACSMSKDMDQMTKSTQGMSDTISKMSDTTSHLATTNDQVLTQIGQTNTTAQDTDNSVKQSTLAVQQSLGQTQKIATYETDIYSDGRPSSALTIRLKALQQMDPTTQDSIDEKTLMAAAFFQGFEYQLWKGPDQEGNAKLDVMIDAAIKEFTRVLRTYLPNDLSKIDLTSNDKSMKDLEALSTGAQEVNEDALPGTPSMLDLIKTALPLKGAIDSGKVAESSLKAWQKDALLYYPELVYYLQVRENFLPAMALGMIDPDFAQVGISADINKVMTILKSKIMNGWSADFTTINNAQLDTFTQWMNEANTTASFLENIGEKTMVDQSIRGLFGTMKINDTATKDTSGNRASAIKSFQSAVQGFATIK